MIWRVRVTRICYARNMLVVVARLPIFCCLNTGANNIRDFIFTSITLPMNDIQLQIEFSSAETR